MIGREKQVLLPQYLDRWGGLPTPALSAAVDSNGRLGRSPGGDWSPSDPLRFLVGFFAVGSLYRGRGLKCPRPDSSTGRGVTGWMSRLPGMSGHVIEMYPYANLP